jgi:hypothetical protein
VDSAARRGVTAAGEAVRNGGAFPLPERDRLLALLVT